MCFLHTARKLDSVGTAMHELHGPLRTDMLGQDIGLSTRSGEVTIEPSDIVDKAAAARLKQARIAAGYRTAKDFAEMISINITTYHHHENGRRSIPRATAQRYEEALALPLRSILFGDQLRTIASVPIVGIIHGRGAIRPMTDMDLALHEPDSISTEMAESSTEPTKVQRQVQLPNPALMEGLEVHGNELYPAYRDGDMVFTVRLVPYLTLPVHLHGVECVCLLADGTRVLRVITWQPDGRATLFGYGDAPLFNQTVVACSPVYLVIRSHNMSPAAD
jgi:DNA-binding XRE family transcriptional regulator